MESRCRLTVHSTESPEKDEYSCAMRKVDWVDSENSFLAQSTYLQNPRGNGTFVDVALEEGKKYYCIVWKELCKTKIIKESPFSCPSRDTKAPVNNPSVQPAKRDPDYDDGMGKKVQSTLPVSVIVGLSVGFSSLVIILIAILVWIGIRRRCRNVPPVGEVQNDYSAVPMEDSIPMTNATPTLTPVYMATNVPH